MRTLLALLVAAALHLPSDANGQLFTPEPGAREQWLQEQRFVDYVKAHRREHELMDKALEKEDENNEFRLEVLNGHAETMMRERTLYERADTAEAYRLRSDERLNTIEQAISGMRSAQFAWLTALGVFFTVVQVALRFIGTGGKTQ